MDQHGRAIHVPKEVEKRPEQMKKNALASQQFLNHLKEISDEELAKHR